MQTLATRLKKSREDAELTQSELAAKAHLKNQSIIGSLESGHRKSSSYIPAIAEALGVNALWLSNGKGIKNISGVPEIGAVQINEETDPVVNDLNELAKLSPDEAEEFRLDIRSALLKARRKKQHHEERLKDREHKDANDPPIDSRRAA